MKRILTIVKHRRIISHYAKLICEHIREPKAIELTALEFNLKYDTVVKIIESNEKYFKNKMQEFNKCTIKIK